jgi:parvulin-like peptidyl-prolyl isomerase
VKKDISIAVIAIVIVFGAMFGVAKTRGPVELTPSHPFVAGEKAAAPAVAAPAGKVVMRVNGEPITEDEFIAAFSTLPPQVAQQFASPQGKQMFAEELVKMKVLEQEAEKRGLDKDPKVQGQMGIERSQTLANAVLSKLVATPSDKDLKDFYEKNNSRMQTLELYGIAIAVQGGTIPPKNGGTPLSQEQAMAKGAQVAQQLQAGADVAQLAKQVSDDKASAARGGYFGTVSPGALPEELDEKVMAMKPGDILGPIPSRLGVCVFKAGARRTQPLEGQMKQQIEQAVRQQQTMQKIDQLRKFAKVDFDPQFFPRVQGMPAPGAR